ncbi:mitochondrial inner membrane protein required for protein import [Lambiella insularis]|nr:mitochondrial inner membrane protein required for protein import [Lambiella insularis]
MLSRTIVRSLRLRPGPVQVVLALHQHRAYAKSAKPRKINDHIPPPHAAPVSGKVLQPKLPSDPASASTIGSAAASANASSSSDKHGQPEVPKIQDESLSDTSGIGNMVPSSGGTEPGNAEPTAAETSSPRDYSELQEEFQTTSTSDQNTAPQSISPSAIDPAEARQQEGEDAKIPFHDLTKGIPSTLDAELAEIASVNRDEPSNVARTSSGGRGDRQMPAAAYITSADRRRNKYYSWMFASMFLLAVTGPVYLGRNWESEEEEQRHPDAPSGWGLTMFYNRVKARLGNTLDYYNEPAFPKLLPNPDPAWERPYTLVLSLQDLLLHSEWTREHGWRMAKRPGVDYFLRYLSQYYELVIFTSESSMMADPWIRKMDPYRIIMWPLFREATRYKNGEYIKDLSYINRPLSKVILLDTVQSHAKLQPENAIILPKWDGNPNDKELVSLIPFLEYVASMGSEDTREVLKSFAGTHIPTEFAAREAKVRERFERQLAEEKAKRPRRSGVGFLGSALGIKSVPGGMDGMQGEGFGEGLAQGKMLQDQIRERGQKQYEMLEKEIRENGDKWLKEMAAEEKKASEDAMKGMKAGMTGWLPGMAKDK